MTNHSNVTAGMSQCVIILKELMAKKNKWVPMPQLASVAGCYAVNSRVSDLRQRGHNIVNKQEKKHGIQLSYYKLVVERVRKEAA